MVVTYQGMHLMRLGPRLPESLKHIYMLDRIKCSLYVIRADDKRSILPSYWVAWGFKEQHCKNNRRPMFLFCSKHRSRWQAICNHSRCLKYGASESPITRTCSLPPGYQLPRLCLESDPQKHITIDEIRLWICYSNSNLFVLTSVTSDTYNIWSTYHPYVLIT